MRKLLLCAILIFAQVCAAATLNANLLSNSVVDVANCGAEDGPGTKKILFGITNEWAATMAVDYEYFDFPSQAWLSGGRLCAVPPAQIGKCEAIARVAMGGNGNGTQSADLIRITATNGDNGEKAQKTFTFVLNHYTGDRESARARDLSNALIKLNETTAALNATCSGTDCCGLSAERASLVDAGAQLADASPMLGKCQLTGLYAILVNATTKINSANSSNFAACRGMLPALDSAKGEIASAEAVVRAGEACEANVLGAQEKLGRARDAYGNATAAMGMDDYAAASASLADASRLVGEADAEVGECGGAIWDPGGGNATANTTVEAGSNTTGGTSEYNAGGDAAAGGGCLGMVALFAFLGGAALLARHGE